MWVWGVGWPGLAWIRPTFGPPGGRILPNQTQLYGKVSTRAPGEPLEPSYGPFDFLLIFDFFKSSVSGLLVAVFGIYAKFCGE